MLAFGGLSGVTSAPELQWRLNKEGRSKSSPPQPATSAIEQRASHDLWRARHHCVFAGIYEFSGLEPEVAYQVELDCPGQTARCLVRTLPEQVPSGPERWLNILLVSCFHYVEATPFAIEQALERAERECRDETGATFHLSLLLETRYTWTFPRSRTSGRTAAGWRKSSRTTTGGTGLARR